MIPLPNQVQRMEIIIDKQPTVEHKDTYVDLPNNDRVRISPWAIDLLAQLHKLPFSTRLDLLNVNEVEARIYLNERLALESTELLGLLKVRWVYKETGDLMKLDDFFDYHGLGSIKKLRVDLKKSKVELEEVRRIKELFVGERSDLIR